MFFLKIYKLVSMLTLRKGHIKSWPFLIRIDNNCKNIEIINIDVHYIFQVLYITKFLIIQRIFSDHQ